MLDTYIASDGEWRPATPEEIEGLRAHVQRGIERLRSRSIVNTSIPLSPEELSAQHMKQQENYTEFLAAERDLWPNFFAPTWHTYTPPEEQ